MKIGHRDIGPDSPPLVIAEMSGNHNQDLDKALQIVDAVATAGAHALKLQTYTADTMTLDIAEGDFVVSDPSSLWHGSSLYSLYQKAYTPWEWHEPIFRRCHELGLVAFSTPFDASAVDFLQELQVPCFKIASFENTDLPLIRKVSATGKPVIISTGMATQAEVAEAVRTARESGCRDLILLKCTSSYPASPAASHLATLAQLRAQFECEVGLSDHTLGIGAAIASVALGATVIEKHVTLSRALGGVDAAFSLEPAELKQLVLESHSAWQARGRVHFGPTEDERSSLVFRRSLYICKDLKAGDLLTPENLRAIRPGYGLPPRYLDQLMGKRLTMPAKRGTPMSWHLIA